MTLRAVVLTAAFAGVILALAVVSSLDLTAPMVGRAVAFSLPLSLLVAKGHFGRRHLSVPSTAGSLFLMWQLTLSPQMVIAEPAAPPWVYSAEAMTIGGVVYFCFWSLYGLFAAPFDPPVAAVAKAAEDKDARKVIVAAVALIIPWLIVVEEAMRRGLISNYAATTDEAESVAGSGGTMTTVLVVMFMYVIPGVAVLLWQTGNARARALAVATGCVAAVAVINQGGRRPLMVVLLLFCVLLASRRPRLRLGHVLAAAGVTAVLMVTLYAYRLALIESSGDANGRKGHGRAFVAGLQLLADSESRSETLEGNRSNLTTRAQSAAVLFQTVQYSMVTGERFHGTLIYPQVVLGIPSVLWAAKSQTFIDSELEGTLIRAAGFPDLDLSPSPISHFVFELGWFVAPLGGIVYAFLVRLADWGVSGSGPVTVARWTFFAPFAAALLQPEGPAFYFLGTLREPAWISLAVFFLVRRQQPPGRGVAPRALVVGH